MDSGAQFVMMYYQLGYTPPEWSTEGDGVSPPKNYDKKQGNIGVEKPNNTLVNYLRYFYEGSQIALDQNNVLGKDGNNVSAENDNGAPQGIMYTSIRCKDILSKVRTADEAGNLSWPQNRYLNSTIKTYLIGT